MLYYRKSLVAFKNCIDASTNCEIFTTLGSKLKAQMLFVVLANLLKQIQAFKRILL